MVGRVYGQRNGRNDHRVEIQPAQWAVTRGCATGFLRASPESGSVEEQRRFQIRAAVTWRWRVTATSQPAGAHPAEAANSPPR